MPTIERFAEQTNPYPDAPAATDVGVARFGRDAAAMANVGGEIGDIGGKLMQARKQAMESDAVANLKTKQTIELDESVDELKKTWTPDSAESASEVLRGRMNKMLADGEKEMPTGDAQRAYRDRMSGAMESKYIETLRWENQTRTAAQEQNMLTRNDAVTAKIYKSPSLGSALEHLKDLNADLNSKAGVSINAADVPAYYNKLGSNIAKTYYAGLADSVAGLPPEQSAKTIAMGRALLKKPPQELAGLLSGDDIRALDNKFDQAERESESVGKEMIQLERRARADRREATKTAMFDAVLTGELTERDINNNPDLTFTDKKVMLSFRNARLYEPKIASEAKYKEMMGLLYADDDDPRKIRTEVDAVNLYNKGGFTKEQLRDARSELKLMSTQAGQVEVEMKKRLFKISDATLKNDPEGQAKFHSYAQTQLAAATDPKLKQEMLDANSPKYLGNAIRVYQKSPQDTFKATVAMAKARAAAPKAKEIAPQPKGMTLMMRPSGEHVYVPDAIADKKRAQGFKDAKPSKGRSPQSVGDGGFDPRAFGGPSDGDYPRISDPSKLSPNEVYETYREEYDVSGSAIAIREDDNLSPEQKLGALQSLREELESDGVAPDDADEGYTQDTYNEAMKLIDRAENEAEAARPKTSEEQRIIESNEYYLRGREVNGEEKTDGKAKGKLPELKTRKGTKAELKAIKNSKSGSLKID